MYFSPSHPVESSDVAGTVTIYVPIALSQLVSDLGAIPAKYPRNIFYQSGSQNLGYVESSAKPASPRAILNESRCGTRR